MSPVRSPVRRGDKITVRYYGRLVPGVVGDPQCYSVKTYTPLPMFTWKPLWGRGPQKWLLDVFEGEGRDWVHGHGREPEAVLDATRRLQSA